MTLDEYFHKINQPPTKEASMLTKLKQYWTDKFIFVDNTSAQKVMPEFIDVQQPHEHDPAYDCEDGYWGFVMYTPEWENEFGETVEKVETNFVEPHNGTWMEVLDKILDAMEAHYGYSIKEQVYYSVTFPLNDVDERTGEPYAGYGRCINDELFQQLLLAHPELYESQMFGKPVKDLYA